MYAIGFYLGVAGTVNEDEEEQNLYRIGILRTADGSFSRKMFSFFCDDVPDVPHGDIVLLRNSEEKPFEDLDTVTMDVMANWMETIEARREETDQDIMYTVQNVVVGERSLPGVGQFYHPHFGIMMDMDGHMYLGKYRLIAFIVQPLADDKYELEIRLGLRENGVPERNDQWKNGNFKIMNELVKAEREHTIKEGTEDWNLIQQLELVGYDESNPFSGHRPIFKPVKSSELSVMLLFQKCIARSAQVRIIRQFKNENGEYEDSECTEHPAGTIVEPNSDSIDTCLVKMKNFYRHFSFIHPIGTIFRFEGDMDDRNVNFWKQQRQLKNPIFAQTLETDNTNRLKTEDVLDKLVMDHKQQKIVAKGEDKDYPSDLNCVQLKAMQMAMNEKRKLVCIQGPPGTGKTLTLATIIANLILDKKQVIVLTPTREANKNIERSVRTVLMEYRGGKELAETALLNQQRFDELLNEDSDAELVVEEIRELRASLEKGEISFEQFVELEQSKLKIAKRQVADRVFSKTLAVFSTITASFAVYAERSKNFHPVVCFIDEAGQVKESETWPGVVGMTRIIMAGDPKQLPSLVKSAEGRYHGLERSLMERIMDRKEQFSWIMLEQQYRSHPAITEWSSNHFYEGKIRNAGELKTLQQIMTKKPPSPRLRKVYDPLVLIDTSYEIEGVNREASWEEAMFTEGKTAKTRDLSYQNRREAEIVLIHYTTLFKKSIDPKKMAIITPYSAQKSLILSKFERNFKMWKERGLEVPDIADVNVNTVDAYQGQEFDVVIFSMVRSNPRFALGFVSEERRLNVAVTRAKYHFCLVGNGVMLAKSRVQSIQDLFRMIQTRQCRFPPCYVSGKEEPYDISLVKNNFGVNFKEFTEKCKDPAMKKYCEELQRKMNDPVYRAQTKRRIQIRKDLRSRTKCVDQAAEDQAVRAFENMGMMPSTSSAPPFFYNQPINQ